MCGIAGFFDADASFLSNEEQYQILLAKMGRTLKHRGPDASGTLLCNRCGLAHRRLSIIDITGGAQPMSKIYSDYHYHIVYNGEIYNTDDLSPGFAMSTWQPVSLSSSSTSFSTSSLLT